MKSLLITAASGAVWFCRAGRAEAGRHGRKRRYDLERGRRRYGPDLRRRAPFRPLVADRNAVARRFSASRETIAAKVESWTDLPPVGGTAMDANGDLYFTDLAENALKRRAPDGRITTVIRDERLHWADAPFMDSDHSIWLPVPQIDRVALFHGGSRGSSDRCGFTACCCRHLTEPRTLSARNIDDRLRHSRAVPVD